MSARERAVIAIWLAVLVGCGAWLWARLVVTTDLSAFLPVASTRTQALLVQQLRDGAVSRMMLIGIEGAEGVALAQTSHRLAARLEHSQLFGMLANGDPARLAADRDAVAQWRYVLSPAVVSGRFTAPGLRAALEEDLDLLASPLGALIKRTLPEDPTGELRQLAALLAGQRGPRSQHDAWFSADGSRALLIAQTRAPGFDLDAQRRATSAVRDAFAEVAPPGARLLVTGPGVFAAESRQVIARDAERATLITAAGIVLLLFVVYRAWQPVALSTVPVLSGLAGGLAAVSAWFGPVHAITIAFGAILIGEAVDYPTYLFASAARGEDLRVTRNRIAATLRLAFLTTACSALAMLLSDFRGLAQLGVLTMAGILAAGLTTQYVLPLLAPASGFPRKAERPPFDADRVLSMMRRGSMTAWVLLAAAVLVIAAHGDALWDDDLGSLNPVPMAAKALDRDLRADTGAPDVRYVVIVQAPDREQALQQSERATTLLATAVERGLIGGFDLAARWLPSRQMQQARLAALPPADALQARLREAAAGLPFRDGVFAPFLAAVEQARAGPLLDRAQLGDTALGARVDALLYRFEAEWIALVPLSGVSDPVALRSLLVPLGASGVSLVDLKAEADTLVAGYRAQSLRLIAIGLFCVAALVYAGTRSLSATLRTLLPVVAAVAVTMAALLAAGQRLTIFHLAALLLVVGVGLNYALFFNRRATIAGDDERTLLALLVAAAATLLAALALAASRTPLLGAIGTTAALGTAVAFATSAMLSRKRP